MARLSDEDEEGISLFPMFNILACTLGVMVFILATVATVSLGADKAVEIVEGVPLEPAPDSAEQTIRDAAFGRRDRRTPLWVEWDGSTMIGSGVARRSGSTTFRSSTLRAYSQ